jgi:hypothetical protein
MPVRTSDSDLLRFMNAFLPPELHVGTKQIQRLSEKRIAEA